MSPRIFPQRLDSAWMGRADLVALIAALGSDADGAPVARYVGGAVRDSLLGAEVKDIDMACILPPETVMRRLAAAGIKTVPTGIEHGTVTAVLPAGPVEITTLRHDVSTDGRRAKVAFSTDWREDAARRDFTINALFADPVSGAISDYFGGLDDLAARRVRFIGDARQRIREDHLRILRYFRFQARFGSYPADSESEMACAELAATLKGLSRERVAMELMNLLALPDPVTAVARMAALGVLAVVLPEAGELGLVALAALVAAERREGVTPAAPRRLAALLPADPAPVEQVAARLRLSGAIRKRLVIAAARQHGEDARVLAYRVGVEGAVDRLLLTGETLAPLASWNVPVFPLKGGQIVARGVGAGPEVARLLRVVEARWINEGFPDATRVMAMLDEALAG